MNNTKQTPWHLLPEKGHTGSLINHKNLQECLQLTLRHFKPKSCIEFGYNVGHSALLMLHELDDDASLVSFDIRSTTAEILESKYKNFKFILGDSVIEFPKHISYPVDFVFIDSEHTYTQVSKEIKVITPNLSIGGILFFDDTNDDQIMKAITDSELFESLNEITNWKDEQHLITTYYEKNGGWMRNKVIRIYQRYK